MDQSRTRRIAFFVVLALVCAALLTSTLHVSEAMAFTAPVFVGWVMGFSVVGMNLGMVATRVIFPGREARRWIFLSIVIAGLVELTSNYLISGLYAMSQTPAGLASFTGQSQMPLFHLVALFGLAPPLLGAIGTGLLAAAAPGVFGQADEASFSEMAKEVLRSREFTKKA